MGGAAADVSREIAVSVRGHTSRCYRRCDAIGMGGRGAAAFNGNFNLYVQTRDLVKQEGIIFRHLLRLILLCGEFAQVCPPETTPAEWQADLRDLSERLTASCREVDPASTDEAIQFAHAADVVEGEAAP